MTWFYRWALLAAALAVLNAALTFANLWPTPVIRWTQQLSVEVALLILLVAIARGRGWVPSRRTLRLTAIAGVLLVIGRYADVTVQSLFGREINLYWDSRHFGAVWEMLSTVTSPWLVAAVLLAVIVLPVVIYLPLRWALGHVTAAAGEPLARRALMLMGAVGVVLGTIQLPMGEEPFAELPKYSSMVTATYLKQARTLAREVSGIGQHELGPPPLVESNFARVRGADVFVIFFESYGATSWDRPEYVRGLAPARERFEAAIRSSGREVVSAFAESPTFGGSSWLAHVSLLAGTEVRDGDTNLRLMSQQGRPTLLTAFKRNGYRTVAVMPGLRLAWPEGRFYGFDEIYGELDLAYRGPSFGWWDITDQYAVAKMDALVIEPRPRPPVFVFMPTVSTHTPFLPSPPYLADWSRIMNPRPFAEQVVRDAWSETPNWLDLGPGYVKALTYTMDVLGGYLELRSGRDFVVIVIGDHQPPAIVTGEGASWEVPVHIIASRPALLARLRQHGFRPGLAPAHPAITRIDGLMPVLLDAFGERDSY